MDPITIGELIAAAASLIGTLLSLSQKSGELELLFQAVLVELDQVLDNQLAMAKALEDIQRTSDAIVRDVGELPARVVAQLYTSDTYADAEVLKDHLLNLIHSPNPHDPELWKRVNDDAVRLELDAKKLAESSLQTPVSPELYSASTAVVSSARALESVYRKYNKWNYVNKAPIINALQSISETLANLVLTQGLPDYIDNKDTGTKHWIDAYEQQMRQQHPIGKLILDVSPTGSDAETLAKDANLRSPPFVHETKLVDIVGGDYDSNSGITNPTYSYYQKLWWRSLISIPMNLEFGPVDPIFDWPNPPRLIVAHIEGSANWITHDPWKKVEEYSPDWNYDEVKSEEPATKYAGFDEAAVAPTQVEQGIKLVGVTLSKRNAMIYFQLKYLTAIQLAKALKPVVDKKIAVLNAK